MNPWDQVALNYEEEIISPIDHCQDDLIFKSLKSIKNKNQLQVIDLGCGTGPLIPFLAGQFKQVTALDFSTQMLTLAQRNLIDQCPELLPRVKFLRKSLTQLPSINDQYDVAVAINSIIMPDFQFAQKTFDGLEQILKSKGKLILVLPALESIQEEFRFTYQREFKKYKNETKAAAETQKKLQASRIDFALGTYNTGDMKQRYFTLFEIQKLLEERSFQRIQIKPLFYKKQFSYNYVDRRKSGPRMFDWFVTVRKR